MNRLMVSTAVLIMFIIASFFISLPGKAAISPQLKPGNLPSVQKKLPPPKVSPSPTPGVDLAVTELWWTKPPMDKGIIGGVNNSQIMAKVSNLGTVPNKQTNLIFSCPSCPPPLNTSCIVSPIKPGDFQWCSRPSVATGDKWQSAGTYIIEAQVDRENVNIDSNLSNNTKSLQFTVAGLPDTIRIKSKPTTAPYDHCIIGKACGLTWELADVGTDKVILELWHVLKGKKIASAEVPNKGYGGVLVPKGIEESTYTMTVSSSDRKRTGGSGGFKLGYREETIKVRPKQIITVSKREGNVHMVDDPCKKYDGSNRGMIVRQYYHVYDWSCTNMTYVYYDFNTISIKPDDVVEAWITETEEDKGGTWPFEPRPEPYICEIAHATNNLWTVPRGVCFHQYPTIQQSTELILSYLKKERKHWGFLFIMEGKWNRPSDPQIYYNLWTLKDPGLIIKVRRYD